MWNVKEIAGGKECTTNGRLAAGTDFSIVIVVPDGGDHKSEMGRLDALLRLLGAEYHAQEGQAGGRMT